MSFSEIAGQKILSKVDWVVQWMDANASFITWLGVASVIMFFGTLIVLPLVLIYLPSDYFFCHRPREANKSFRSSVTRPLLLIAKNLIGVVFSLAGLAMLVLPGQGVIAILVGISLLSIPGKRRILLRILSQPNVNRTINWMRSKGHKPPLQIPPT